jgi:dCMP deaminase
MIDNEKWDQRWMKMALLVASWSKDPRTQVGAVLVRDRRILSTGFNGFPQRTSDDPSIYDNRPEKIKRIVHAEANAVAQAAMFGHSTHGATCYCTFPICCKCAGFLIQAGISRVVIPEWNEFDPVQHEYLDWPLSQDLFAESGVILDSVDMVHGNTRNEQQENLWVPCGEVRQNLGRGDHHGRG